MPMRAAAVAPKYPTPKGNQGDRMFGEHGPCAPTMRPSIQHAHFIGSPDLHIGAKATDHGINVVAFNHKDIGWLVCREDTFELKAARLIVAHVKPQLQPAAIQKFHRRIARQYDCNPRPSQRLQRFFGWCQIQSNEQSNRHEKGVPRQETMRQPCKKFWRARLPHKNRGRRDMRIALTCVHLHLMGQHARNPCRHGLGGQIIHLFNHHLHAPVSALRSG